MQKVPLLKCCSVAICVLLVCAELTSGAPTYGDYESIKDLYELLLQKEALEDQLSPAHQVVRKSNKAPLRLRYGKRSDPYLTSPHYIGQPGHILEDVLDN